ncbi:MAG: succinate dehydrogenase [Candidatus Zixiibacteriota bacterium]
MHTKAATATTDPVRAAKTLRSDRWWASPVAVALGFGVFIVYSTWAAFQNAHFLYTGGGAYYLSPFYSPDLIALLGDFFPAWLPAWIPHSPAFLILWAPAGFRTTCYYYRKAYYRAYVSNPVACAVRAHDRKYIGEAKFPLILQNVHRYFFYLAVIIIFILAYDAIISFSFDGEFGMGLGSLILTLNVIFLSSYTFGCHSLRHLIGGKLNCFTCDTGSMTRHKMWKGVTVLNRSHQFWAWMSLLMVGFSDLYVRLCSMGVWTDIRFF